MTEGIAQIRQAGLRPSGQAVADDLLARYDQPVPRYTSYPTAPHFHASVDDATYRQWLENLPQGESLSVYSHIPFCAEMCWFCGCHTKIVRRYPPIADYVGLLAREYALVAQALGGKRPVRHIHWGGGSPTMLAPEDFIALMRQLARHYAIADDCDIAVEIDPRTIDADKIAAFAAMGVNRASLGVQDGDPAVQQAIHRVQPMELVAQTVAQLRQAGIKDISLDLIYGLPRQSPASVERTIAEVAALRPNRIALFGYAHVPWMKRHQRLINDTDLPDSQARARLAGVMAERLLALGYRRIGLDHFAQPDDPAALALARGDLKRNFQGYTVDRATSLIGFGASAIGSLPQGYAQNTAIMRDYRDAIAQDRLATSRGIALGPDDRIRRTIIERLMCQMEVDLNFAQGIALGKERMALKAMAADGLVVIAGENIKVTERGRPFLRAVCAVFDSYFKPREAQHSKVI